MVTFRNNNNRRNNFRRNDRNFKSHSKRPKYGTNFSNNENFQRKIFETIKIKLDVLKSEKIIGLN